MAAPTPQSFISPYSPFSCLLAARFELLGVDSADVIATISQKLAIE